MKHIDYSSIELKDGFWIRIQDKIRHTTTENIYRRFAETGRFDALNFDWKEGMPNRPHYYWDSDIAKWIETVAHLITKKPEPRYEAMADEIIDKIATHQEESGYFNICFQLFHPETRFQDRGAHELYCAGHLIEAAVAYYKATGKNTLLNVACRYADYIEKCFVIEKSTGFVTPGHEEIELALLKLYRVTGEERYLELAEFFLNQRGMRDEPAYPWAKPAYTQSHLPIRQQRTAEGHAVRAMYLYCAMAELAAERQDAELMRACEAIFEDVLTKKMFITGAIGSSRAGESFTIPYDLPNLTGYAESCAAIGLAMFCLRMQRISCDVRYADTFERLIYNGILSSISLDGRAFFYENPQEILPQLSERDACVAEPAIRMPPYRRKEVFVCSCCPPNITRFLATIADGLYTSNEDAVYCHQYMASEAKIIWRGEEHALEQITDYPRSGKVVLRYRGSGLTLRYRLPEWCRTAESAYQEYCFSDGDELALDFGMPIRIMEADPRVHFNGGRVAVMRGPVVYCAEEADNGVDLHSVVLPRTANFTENYDAFIDGIVLTVPAFRRKPLHNLYVPVDTIKTEEVSLRLIPYRSFGNRKPGEMLIWLLHS